MGDSTSMTTSVREEEETEVDLPKEKWSLSPYLYLYLYQNFWCPSDVLRNVMWLRGHFEAQDSDILLATKPKSGTTWLKALAFAILNRRKHPIGSHLHPLLSANPQELVTSLEYPAPGHPLVQLSKLDPPRLLSTHLPYSALPESSLRSRCRIVYLCRNPFDTVVSYLKFKQQLLGEKDQDQDQDQDQDELEGCVDRFCRGVEGFGPHWDHVLGYWNTSLETPAKVLFLKYEDLKADPISHIRKLALFLGVPFTPEEEETGLLLHISTLCSFQNLKELEVNKTGRLPHNVDNKAFFRKGEVGDWSNHMPPALFHRIDRLMRHKFHGTGLSFQAFST